MLTTIRVGLAGALLMFAGDMLLYYTPKDFSYGPKSSTEKRLNAIIDVMKSLPARRVMVGGMIGPVAAFLLWHHHRRSLSQPLCVLWAFRR